MELIPRDTTPEAARIQREIFRRMTPSQRLEMAFSLSESLRQLVGDGVRHRHPDYTDAQVRLAVAKITLGKELFDRAYPGQDIET